MYVGISDKVLNEWIKDKDYIGCSDEGEVLAICAGAWLATGERWTAFFSADGFCNALNFLTSYIIPEGIEMNIIISTGRQEPSHKVMSDILNDLLKLLPYDPKKIVIDVMRK